MPLALLCSGQGGQHAGMFANLFDGACARPILSQVAALAGIDLLSGSMDVPSEALAENRTAQLLVVGHALAAFAELSARGVSPAVFAGYSAGEIAAHGCAGALSAADTLAMVDRRAGCMDTACGGGPAQGMVATIGLTRAEAERAAKEAGVFVAIVNGPDHVVAGGPVEALGAYEAAAAPRARHVRRLAVRIASHTPLLAAAGPCFSAVVADSGWRAPAAPVLSGLDGRAIRNREEAAEFLAAQLHRSLDWARCLECVFEYGATAVLEVGPGRALTKMVEEAYPATPARAFEDFRTPDGAARWALRHM